ncbi:cell wall-binding repeat-containing protein [Microbacterium bovistercoris]|uniref:cell wall-binding repeat-containing protein n=1 Tax=Microbacterium bovistercoris TaxID=2293570 RepID=UPI0015F26B21|nr:cell wall-binding repeat-containing protein [Microbacterium bovistercoris]
MSDGEHGVNIETSGVPLRQRRPLLFLSCILLGTALAVGVGLPGSANSAQGASAGGTVSGTVTGDDGAPVSGVIVNLCTAGASIPIECPGPFALTDASGRFALRDMAPGEYTLSYQAEGYAPQFWEGQDRAVRAEFFTLSADEELTGRDAALRRGATISGRITDVAGSPLADASVYVDSPVYRYGGAAFSDWSFTGAADASGAYSITGLPSSEYTVEFLPPSDRELQREYWPGGTDIAMATPIRVIGTQGVAGIDATLIRPLSQSRIAGPDRYATSAAISLSHFPAGVGTAFVANGGGFPDALGGASAAALRAAPLLLSGRDALPAVVRAELERLKPRTVTVLGGEGAISAAVEQELRELSSEGLVRRLGGASRYETAAAVSRWAFSDTLPSTVYLASGEFFPDALSAAHLAGRDDAPLLLVTRTALPAAVAAELARIKPERIVLLGGTGAIDRTVEAALSKYSENPVTRVSGEDRCATSVAASRYGYRAGDATGAYFASGTGFADALAGAPVAAITGGPVLLTPPAAFGSELEEEFLRLQTDRAVILGGTGSIGVWVCSALERLGGPTLYDGGSPSAC